MTEKQTEKTEALATKRPVSSCSTWCAPWSRAAPPWRSPWPCGSAGERLAQICQDWLDGARQRLEDVIAERDGD